MVWTHSDMVADVAPRVLQPLGRESQTRLRRRRLRISSLSPQHRALDAIGPHLDHRLVVLVERVAGLPCRVDERRVRDQSDRSIDDSL